MKESTATNSRVHELIRERWSPRAFSSKKVEAADLAAILEAGRWAASSYNEQPWRFIVATKDDEAAYRKMLSILMPFNQDWAKSAPVLILVVARKAFSHNNQPNKYALHDAGAALANMSLQATALGLHTHGMGGFDHERARIELNLPTEYDTAAFVALGFAGSPDELPDPLKQRELAVRDRKPLSEIAFTTEWQTPFPL